MSIKVQDLLTQKARKFGFSENTADTQQIILDSVNYVLDDIENRVGIATTRVTGIGSEIDLDQQTYQSLISIGVDFYLQDISEYTIQSLAGVEDRYNKKLADAQSSYYRSIDMNMKFGDSSSD